ncbi:hypothetical protein T03_12186 [Trichinella britovi]|uniref:FLYWCH-type domain-containing protein n=1 Tax=Trichinella britovi TaxID=45882 RepID=A0A0V0ZR54_TRIBR|nr:hypothetical protein T03_12186 [Trichinella britovi]
MADITELRFVPNRGGSTSLVSQGRTYKLRYTNKQRKHWVCSKVCAKCTVAEKAARGHMDKPGCDICDHAKGSHRKLPSG